MKHLFLTGEKQIGKSTLLRRWLSRTDAAKGGFFTRKAPVADGHIYVHMLRADRDDSFRPDNLLFDCRRKDPVETPKRFELIGCPLLEESAGADLIVMDEIGHAENASEPFCRAILDALDGSAPVIGVLRQDQLSGFFSPRAGGPLPLAFRIAAREDVTVIEVTKENRDSLAETLPDILTPFMRND